MPRLTFFDWTEATLDPLRVLTSSDGGPAPEALTPKEHVRRALGIDVADASGDLRPTLVYFHWPHDDPLCGKTSDTLCRKTLNAEGVARWGLLFRCVQVDMAASDPKLTALLGAGKQPSFVVVDKDASVVARIAAVPSSSKMEKALESALQKLPDAWKRLQGALAEQEKALALAKAKVKADKAAEAKPLLDPIRYSEIRVGPHFDAAMALAREVEARMDRDQLKGR